MGLKVQVLKKSHLKARTEKKPVKKSVKKLVKSERKSIGTTKKTKKIGLFGGTFNPVHYGHLNSIESIMQSFKFDEMWIIPAFQNPLKLQIQVPSVDSRISLLEIGLRTIDPNFEKIKILDIEARDTKPSFTIQTISDLTKRHPECEFYLCIGADQFSVFDQWSKFKDILKISNLIITSRPGFELPKNKQESPEWL
ncbi:MAG: nicotinate (nicotinamide) nucleotide adenylyltransferase, partial [Bdellovibrionales bacterium]